MIPIAQSHSVHASKKQSCTNIDGINIDSSGWLSAGSFGKDRGSVCGGSLLGDGENSAVLGTLDKEGEDDESVDARSLQKLKLVEEVMEVEAGEGEAS